jgi:hypothetical protein
MSWCEVVLEVARLVVAVLEVAATAWLAYAIISEVEALIRQHRADAFAVLLRRIQDPLVREARRQLQVQRRAGNTGGNAAEWDDNLRSNAELAASRYDELGLLVLKVRSIDRELVFPMWAPSIVTTWEAAKSLIVHQRLAYQDPWRFTHFEELAREARMLLEAERSRPDAV